MNLLYGEIVETLSNGETSRGKIRVHGALREVALTLTPDAHVGDCILVCDGVALGKVADDEWEKTYVLGDSGKNS